MVIVCTDLNEETRKKVYLITIIDINYIKMWVVNISGAPSLTMAMFWKVYL